MKLKPQIKKIPYYTALTLLTGGASLILGLLSFGGMLVLTPLLPLAFSAFVLSVAYEGEIYLQNIRKALNKLFKQNVIKLRLANEYLYEHFPDTSKEECPQFFKDYEAQCKLLMQFEHKTLNKTSLAKKKQIDKTLRDMEKWFAAQLFPAGEDNTLKPQDYQKKLQAWLKNNPVSLEWDAKLNKHTKIATWTKGFSALAAFFMGVGTTYLLVEAFAVIPYLAALSTALLPVFIVPMAIIAGVAYGLLTYNAMTDFFMNDTISKWFRKIQSDLSQGWSLRNIFMAVTAVLLAALAVGLTLCTAGTWWTIANQVKPLFAWMGKLPNFIMGVINPIITGISSMVFNLQNTAESIEIIDGAVKSEKSFWQTIKEFVTEGIAVIKQKENLLQWINPFRLFLKLTVMPLRILLFLGHIVSIGLVADRVPGIPEIVSALLGIISEGFEDMHYFVPHSHGHAHGGCCSHDFKHFLKERLAAGQGHNHDVDLPTRLLKVIFSPIYASAALWDMLSSRFNKDPKPQLTFAKAWNKQMGVPEEDNVVMKAGSPLPSTSWKKEQALLNIEQYKGQLNQAAVGSVLAKKKVAELGQLQQQIAALPESTDFKQLKQTIEAAPRKTFNQHRFFSSSEKTATSEFLDDLSARISMSPLANG